MGTDKILKNIRVAKYIISIGNVISAGLFFLAFVISENEWHLIASLTLFVVSIASLFYFSYVEKKFQKILSKKKENG